MTMVEGDTEFGFIAGGQVAGLIDDVPTVSDLIKRVMREAAAVLQGFCG